MLFDALQDYQMCIDLSLAARQSVWPCMACLTKCTVLHGCNTPRIAWHKSKVQCIAQHVWREVDKTFMQHDEQDFGAYCLKTTWLFFSGGEQTSAGHKNLKPGKKLSAAVVERA